MGKEIKFPKHMGLFNTSWQPKYIIHMHTHKSTIQLVMKFSNKDILTPTCCTISLNLFSLTPIWNSWSFIVGFKIYEQYNNCPFENIPVAGLMGLKRCCKLKNSKFHESQYNAWGASWENMCTPYFFALSFFYSVAKIKCLLFRL